MMAPQAATCFRQWVILPEKCSGADAIMQAEMNRDIISAPCLTYPPQCGARTPDAAPPALGVLLGGDEGLEGGNHRLGGGEDRLFTHDQGHLAQAVVHSAGLLPGRMVLPELDRQVPKVLQQRVTRGMHDIVHAFSRYADFAALRTEPVGRLVLRMHPLGDHPGPLTGGIATVDHHILVHQSSST